MDAYNFIVNFLKKNSVSNDLHESSATISRKDVREFSMITFEDVMEELNRMQARGYSGIVNIHLNRDGDGDDDDDQLFISISHFGQEWLAKEGDFLVDKNRS